LTKKCYERKLDIQGFVVTSELGKKERKKQLDGIKEILDRKETMYLMSTGSLIGEGFDLPALSTLFLTTPISFKGRLIQYAGRLHRDYEGKKETVIYDYVDTSIGLTVAMFKKRVTTYRKRGI